MLEGNVFDNKILDYSHFFDEDSFFFMPKDEKSDIYNFQNSSFDFNFADSQKSFEENKLNNIFNDDLNHEHFYLEKHNILKKVSEELSSIQLKTKNDLNKSYSSFECDLIEKITIKKIDQSLSIKNNTTFSTLLKKDEANNSNINYSYYFNKNDSIFSNKKRKRNPPPTDITFQKNAKEKFIVEKSRINTFKVKKISNKRNKVELINELSSKCNKPKKTHDKFFFDNISKKFESLSINFIINTINSILKNIKNIEFKKYYGDEMFLKIGNKEENKPSKKYYRELMNKKFKSIFSENTSKIYNYNKESHNSKLIGKLYELNQKGYLEFSKIVNFLELKFEDFWKLLSIYLKYKDKISLKGKCILDEIDDNYDFIKELIKKFICHIDFYMEKRNEEEQYRTIFKYLLIDFHLRFENL